MPGLSVMPRKSQAMSNHPNHDSQRPRNKPGLVVTAPGCRRVGVQYLYVPLKRRSNQLKHIERGEAPVEVRGVTKGLGREGMPPKINGTPTAWAGVCLGSDLVSGYFLSNNLKLG